MAVFSGPRTPFVALEDGTSGSFWSPRVLKSLWQDTAGTIPATVNSQVKRMDDLSGLGNHMIAPTGSRTVSSYTYTFKGPTLKQEGSQYYLDFDGDGAGLQTDIIKGSWPIATGNTNIGISLSVAFQTNSVQPALPSSGLGGTWLGTDALGNFGGVWQFGLRLSNETMFYATVRNANNTLWITQWDENNIYSNLSTSQWLDKKIIYTASGTLNSNATFGCFEWIDRTQTTNSDNNPFAATTELPVPLNNRFVIGARSPTNDNWIAGRFYGGAIIAKKINDSERNIIEDFLYINTYM